MPPPLLPTLFFFLLLTAAAQDSDPGPDCTGRWIHIRQLPPQFNLDLLSNCSEYPVSGDFCPFVGNHGLGQKTHNSSRSWYRTDPLMLELIFHRRMLEYPCLTPDPSLASAIYLPYYAGLDALHYLYGPDQNTSFLHGLDLFRFLTRTHRPEIWNRRQGHDPFLIPSPKSRIPQILDPAREMHAPLGIFANPNIRRSIRLECDNVTSLRPMLRASFPATKRISQIDPTRCFPATKHPMCSCSFS